MKLCNW